MTSVLTALSPKERFFLTQLAAHGRWEEIRAQADMPSKSWEALQRLVRNGFVEMSNARLGPLGLPCEEKMIRVTVAGLCALNFVPKSEP